MQVASQALCRSGLSHPRPRGVAELPRRHPTPLSHGVPDHSAHVSGVPQIAPLGFAAASLREGTRGQAVGVAGRDGPPLYTRRPLRARGTACLECQEPRGKRPLPLLGAGWPQTRSPFRRSLSTGRGRLTLGSFPESTVGPRAWGGDTDKLAGALLLSLGTASCCRDRLPSVQTWDSTKPRSTVPAGKASRCPCVARVARVARVAGGSTAPVSVKPRESRHVDMWSCWPSWSGGLLRPAGR